MTSFYLDWRETQHAKQPKPQEVELWLTLNGFEPEGTPVVYKNGGVLVECGKGNPSELWASFEPPVMTIEDTLGAHIKALLAERAIILQKPEGQRTSIERGTLAVMGLLLYGYGVEVD